MATRDQLLHDLENLTEPELDYVSRLVTTLRTRPSHVPLPAFDPAVYGPLYREFGQEDRDLAEEGIDEYAETLKSEDGG